MIATGTDIVVVTTGIGFRSWLDTAETAGLGHDLVEALRGTRLVARGPKARGAIQAAGLVPDWVAESETSAEIADFLVTKGVQGLTIAVQHHGAGDDGLEKRLAAAGGRPFGLVVYRWGPPPDPEAVERSVRDAAAGAYDSAPASTSGSTAAVRWGRWCWTASRTPRRPPTGRRRRRSRHADLRQREPRGDVTQSRT
ncbi:MAG: uroporphyrinogen-III synthase [Aeromicrobium sp.]|nr:uroporphyrinogen-III synthase [Aeromicrobium sp.]